MSAKRAILKNIFYKIGMAKTLDFFLFKISQLRNRRKNAHFRLQNPHLAIPLDYYLYETYLLDYEQFYTDGERTAKEIIEWTGKYLQQKQVRVLDFGCGVSRTTIHLNKFLNGEAIVHGCDVNEKMIRFNKESFKNISYSVVPFSPPTIFEGIFFDLVYAISIFTHIRASLQDQWLKEIHRILKVNGIFLLTTHGTYFEEKLLEKERQILRREGVFTKEYGQEGHRMMSTYNSCDGFKKLLHPYFEILEYHDGLANTNKIGGQDLWIVKRK